MSEKFGGSLKESKKLHEVRTQIRVSNIISINTVEGNVKIDCTIRSSWKISQETYNRYENKLRTPAKEWKDWQPDLHIHNELEGEGEIFYELKKITPSSNESKNSYEKMEKKEKKEKKKNKVNESIKIII